MGFSRQEYWGGLLFLSLGDLPNPGIEFVSPALAGKFFTTEPPGKPRYYYYYNTNMMLLLSLLLELLLFLLLLLTTLTTIHSSLAFCDSLLPDLPISTPAP